MADVENMNRARAEKHGDARLWTPLDALRDLVRRVESGEDKPDQMIIHWTEKNPDGTVSPCYCVAGVTRPEHIALLEVAKQIVVNDWRSV